MLEVHRHSSIEWNPSPVIALATSVDDSQVAAAREDGSLEIWLVSPGSIGWHCQLTIYGDPKSRVSSLVWCSPGSNDSSSGRLFSSSIDGSVSEWDLFNLNQKNVLDSIGVSIWQMAVEPYNYPVPPTGGESHNLANGFLDDKPNVTDDPETSESEDDTNSIELKKHPSSETRSLALACDDGSVRIYTVSDSDELIHSKSLPRVTGRILSVAWSLDAKLIYSGSSDGFIRCWDVKLRSEMYRITAGRGGSGPKSELCIWSLLVLRSDTVVSADSSGSVQFWDSEHGTLLQAHSLHKGDVYALAAAPSHNRVFSAGSDGQVIIYKHSSNKPEPGDDTSALILTKQWIYIGYVRAHTHDVRALTMAVPNHQEDSLPVEKVKRVRQKKKPTDFSYRKWAHLGVPMLISAGDDTKLFAYSAMEFTNFSPHDICPTPQRMPMQLVHTSGNECSLLLVQAPYWLDILSLHTKNRATHVTSSGNIATTNLLARVKSKESMKIICSSISASGVFFAYSNHMESRLFELKRSGGGQNSWSINKKKLPRKLPFAHSMIFSSDSSRLMISGHDRKIYVVDVSTSKLLHSFTPTHDQHDDDSLPPMEPPITRMFCSSDDQWLAAVNCFGDMYIFNLEIQRQHWFISRMNGAAVTAAGFPPQNSNVLIISTSSNQVYVFDVEARQLGEWSMRNTFVLPRRYQDFPGEVLGLSFLPSSTSSRVVIYSARAMCWIDFGMEVEGEEDWTSKNNAPVALNGSLKRKFKEKKGMGRRKNFEFCGFRDPVLFVGHLWKNSVLVVDKPWIEVAKSFPTPPVHRHIFGT